MRIPGSRTVKNIWKKINQHGIILLYHRVVDLADTTDPWNLCVTPAHFKEHLEVLAKNSKPISLRKMCNSLKSFPFEHRNVVITFDDGYRDNFHNAKPLLEKYEIPATFFIVSEAINSQKEFWWDELERFILTAKDIPPIFDLTIASKKYHWIINQNGIKESLNYGTDIVAQAHNDTSLSRSKLYFNLWKILSEITLTEKKASLIAIEKWSQQSTTPRATHFPMTLDELKNLAAHPLFEIGAHTLTHPMLSRLSVREQEAEITESKRHLEDMMGQSVASFSYPHGDQSEDTLKIIELSKLENACTVVQKPVLRNTNPFLLPRFTVLNWNGDEFEKKLHEWLTNHDESSS